MGEFHLVRAIVMGDPLDVEAMPFQILADVRDAALRSLRHTGRPPVDWEAFTPSGERLSMDSFVDDLDLVYLSPNIGCGGSVGIES